MKITISGNDYKIGDVSASEANCEFLNCLFAMNSGTEIFSNPKLFIQFRNLLKEAIASGEKSEKKAEKALSDLKLSFKEGSDLMLAFEGLCKSLME